MSIERTFSIVKPDAVADWVGEPALVSLKYALTVLVPAAMVTLGATVVQVASE